MEGSAPLTDDEIYILSITAMPDNDRLYGFHPPQDNFTDSIFPANRRRGECYRPGEAEFPEAFSKARAHSSVILVLGGGGPLGRAFVASLEASGKFVLNVPSKNMLDVRYTSLSYYLDDISIEIAFLLAWDYQQSDEENAFMTASTAYYLGNRTIPFVFFSTVHAARAVVPFGAAKSLAEARVLDVGGHVVRLPDVFGVEDWHVGDAKIHYIGTIINKCVRGDMTPVAADFKVAQMGVDRATLFADDVADALARFFFSAEGLLTSRLPAVLTVVPVSNQWVTVTDIAVAINAGWRALALPVGAAGTPESRRKNGLIGDRRPNCVPAEVVAALRAAVAVQSPQQSGENMAQLEQYEGDLLRVTPSATLRDHLSALIRLYRDRRNTWLFGAAETRPYVSIITGVRADDYGGNIMERTQVAVDHIAHFCDRYMVSYELVFVEWNALPGRSFAQEIVIPPSMRGRVRVISVPPSLHASLGCGAKMLDMWAKNVGMRRARGEYLINFIPDSLWGEDIFELLALRRLSPDTIYLAYRVMAESLIPDDVHAGGPSARIAWLHEHTAKDRRIYEEITRLGRNRPPSVQHYYPAAGDFVIAHRDAIRTKIRGYIETCDVRHIDSIFVRQGFHKNLSLSYMPGFIYHQYHASMESLHFPVDRAQRFGALRNALCAGVVIMQLSRLVATDGDWGFWREEFEESVL